MTPKFVGWALPNDGRHSLPYLMAAEDIPPAPPTGRRNALKERPVQFLDLSTIFWIHGIMPRSCSPTTSMSCAALLRRIAVISG